MEEGIIISIIIGCVAGYAGSKLFSGSSHGLLMNLIIGIIGGFLGNFVFGLLNIGVSGIVWSLISATVGAVILLWLISLIRK